MLAAVAGTAFAVSAAAAAPPATRNWTGFYIGGNVGAVLEHASGTSYFLDPSALLPSQQVNSQGNSLSDVRFIGGVQAGYDWQFNQRWVAGIEADWDWTHSGSSFCQQINFNGSACNDSPLTFGFQSISSTTDWIATLRGRLGATVGDFLLYGTGGIAWGHLETNLTQNCPTNCGNSNVPRVTSVTDTTDKVGWVAGLGAEYAFNGNWSARAEWLYVDLGNVDSSMTVATTAGTFPFTTNITQTSSWSRSEQYHQFRVGVNYRFH